MLTNRVPLDAVARLPLADIAALSAEELMLLANEIAEFSEQIKKYNARLTAALEMRFAARAADVRFKAGKDTGVTHLAESGFDISCDLPKRVKWDQSKLKSAIETIKGWGSNPDEFVSTEYKVSESKYNAWPSEIRDLFFPARTVETGTQKFSITKKVTI